MKQIHLTKTFLLIVSILFVTATLATAKIARADSTNPGAQDVAVACLKAAGIQAAAQEIEAAAMAIFDTMNVYAETTSVPISNIPIEIASEQSAIWEQFIKGFEDCLIYGLGQLALNKLNKNTVDWIKRGFGDHPLFATRPNQLYLNLSAHVASDIGNQVTTIGIPDFTPDFVQNLSKQLQLDTRQNSRDKFAASLRPSFPEGVDPAAFYNDFNQGGWDAYRASLEDNNNPFGVIELSKQELDTRQQEAHDLQQEKLNWSGGFIDLPDPEACDYPDDIRAKVESDGQPGSPEPYSDDELIAVEMMYCKITTPGKVIQSQTTATVDNDIQRYGFVDTLSKLVNTFMVQMSQKAVQGIF